MIDTQLLEWDVAVTQVVLFERIRLTRTEPPISATEVTTDAVEYATYLREVSPSTYRRPWVSPVACKRRRIYYNEDTTVAVEDIYVVFKRVQSLTYQRIVARLPRRSKQRLRTREFVKDRNMYDVTCVLWGKSSVPSQQRDKLRERFDVKCAQCMTALRAMTKADIT